MPNFIQKSISTYCSNYQKDEETSINIQYNSLSEENKKKILELKQKYPENFYIKKITGFYGHLNENNQISDIDNIDGNIKIEVVFGLKDCSGKSVSQINLEMNKLIANLEKQEYLQDSYTREQIIQGKHLIKTPLPQDDGKLYYEDGTVLETEEKLECKDNKREYNGENTNDEIAANEGLIYSEKYKRFFKDLVTKSRYIESLYRNEHDLRTESEIASENGVFCGVNNSMFFENEKEMKYYEQEEKFKKWSEGNNYLFELFKNCYKKGITTVASCGGHENRNAVPYISFTIDDTSLPYLNNIIEEISNMSNSWIAYHFQLPFEKEEWNKDNISKTIQFYATNENCCELFYRINKAIDQKNKAEVVSNQTLKFIEKLNNLYSKPLEELYNLVANNNGKLVNYIGEKDRILGDINSGKFKGLQKGYFEEETQYNQTISSADIVEADMNRKISQSRFKKVIQIFQKLINIIRGKGGR